MKKKKLRLEQETGVYIYIYIYIYINGHKSSTTHRVLKYHSQRQDGGAYV